MQIEIEVTGQKIKRLNSPGSVADTLNYLTCHFIFVGEEWDITVRTAYFNNQKSGERYAQIIADDGTCTVPWEALTDKGFVRFSVAGERDDYRITTDIESFYNGETVYGGEPSEPPTPSQYDQLIALAEQTKEIAESVREDADAGEFDGEPGKPGDPGKDGVSPTAKIDETNDGAVITVTDATGTTTAKLKNGKDGNPGQDATDEQVQAAVDAYMAEHPAQVDTDDLIKIAIKEEASGAVPIVTTDSAEMGVQDLTMQGWTEQAQYEGKNLFDKSEIVLSGTTITYMPVNVGDGEYTLSTNYISPGRNDVFFLPGNVNTGASSLSNGVEHGTSRTVTSENGYVTVALRLSSDGTTSPLDYQIMLNEGSTALPYEPYTGRQPSPNPDYPQEITSAGKCDEGTGKYEHEVKLTGANLFNPEKLTGGEIVEYNGVQCYKYTDGLTNFTYIDDFAENTQYCINVRALRLEENENRLVTIRINYTDGSIQRSVLSANELVSLVSSVDKTIESISGDDNYSLVCYLDLSMTTLGIGTEPLPFQPYKEQTVLLTADRPLTKWDKLEKRNGQWGWVHKSGSYTVTGEEDYTSSIQYIGERSCNAYFMNPELTDTTSNRNDGYCNSLERHPALWIDNSGIVGFSYNGHQTHIRISNSETGATKEDPPSDVAQKIKAYAAQKYEEGNPFIFWYETAEETFVPLSESEQSALNALTTYYPTTVLDNDQGCEMSVQYIADTKAYIDKKISAIQAAIVNTI